MPRLARVIVPGCPHHITHRGNRHEDIFFTPHDRDRYISLLKQYADRHALNIIAWCLMTNHIHLVAVPERPESLAESGRTRPPALCAMDQRHEVVVRPPLGEPVLLNPARRAAYARRDQICRAEPGARRPRVPTRGLPLVECPSPHIWNSGYIAVGIYTV